jgi:hypothetical protein
VLFDIFSVSFLKLAHDVGPLSPVGREFSASGARAACGLWLNGHLIR